MAENSHLFCQDTPSLKIMMFFLSRHPTRKNQGFLPFDMFPSD